jgi:hypothetical protein
MILGTYDESYGELREDEYLLKLRDDYEWDWDGEKHQVKNSYKTGFLSKLTKKGEVPIKFKDWGKTTYGGPVPTTYVWQESFRSGWKLKSWRIGKSQEWAKVQHPDGFLVEIYWSNFLEIVLDATMDQGVLVGEYKWEANKLIKKK